MSAFGRRFWPALRTAHAWSGLAACVFLFAVALSGALLVFKEPWLRATVPGADAAPVVDAPRLAAAAEAAERTFASRTIRSMTLGSERFALHEVTFADGGGAWLDPRTFGIVEQWPPGGRLTILLLEFHHELLAEGAGETVVGTAALVGLLLVLSGFAYWAKLRFHGARAWPRSGTAREFDSAHRTWGLVLALPLLVMLASGATMALPRVSKPVLGVVTGERAAAAVPAADDAPSAATAAPTIDWPLALGAAARRFPDARIRMLVWPRSGDAAYARLRRDGEWHYNGKTVLALGRDGRVLQVQDATRAPRADRAFNAMWSVHASRIGGPVWQVLTCATGLGLAVLTALGALGYLRRRKKPSSVSPRTQATR